MRTLGVDVIARPLSSSAGPRAARAEAWETTVDVIVGGRALVLRGIALAFTDQQDAVVVRHAVLHDQNEAAPLVAPGVIALLASHPEVIGDEVDELTTQGWRSIASAPPADVALIGYAIEVLVATR